MRFNDKLSCHTIAHQLLHTHTVQRAPFSSLEGSCCLINCWVSAVAFSSTFESIFIMLLNPYKKIWSIRLRGKNKLVRRECLIPPHVYTLFVFLTLNTVCWILPKPWHEKMFSTGKMKGLRLRCMFAELSSLHSTPRFGYESCVFSKVTGRQPTSVFPVWRTCFSSPGILFYRHCLQTGRNSRERALPFLTAGFPLF